ncbi:hypothetical protein HY380_01520 [Candidatus Saccharibacteria bacterium]|nr:hypothetical protein [Candidatus Saccharibacteria bacterium]
MSYRNPEVAKAARQLKAKLSKLEDKRAIFRAPELKALFDRLKTLPPAKRASFGKEINGLKNELGVLVETSQVSKVQDLRSIDVTAPFDINVPSDQRPGLLPAGQGSRHPLMTELENILDIFYRMGFTAVESRELDDDYHMFGSLNFPAEHPARDDYDTFVTDEGLIAPAHTSTMQNRVLKAHKKALESGQPIAVIIPGRTFRNEDVDASHEHTLHQIEGVFVGEGIHAGHLIATLKAFLEEYYGRQLEVKIQPFYFPFTEPSFEFAMSCPFCDNYSSASRLDAAPGSSEERASRRQTTVSERQSATDTAMRQEPAGATGSAGGQGKAARGGRGCPVCQHTGWIELLGCGLIHPNVLKEAGIDPAKYTGFAWGLGTMRLVMMKYGIEDIRHFNSGNLKFLRQFA